MTKNNRFLEKYTKKATKILKKYYNKISRIGFSKISFMHWQFSNRFN